MNRKLGVCPWTSGPRSIGEIARRVQKLSHDGAELHRDLEAFHPREVAALPADNDSPRFSLTRRTSIQRPGSGRARGGARLLPPTGRLRGRGWGDARLVPRSGRPDRPDRVAGRGRGTPDRRYARSLGAEAERVQGIADLELALARAKTSSKSYVIVVDTDPLVTTEEGGARWDVAVPQTSSRSEVRAAYEGYAKAQTRQKLV